MCGRFSLTVGDWDIESEFGVRVSFEYRPRYNIAPSQEVLVLLDDGVRRIEALRWGLIPSWAKDAKIGYKMINARAETIFDKPAFRSAVKQRRCLVLADGFYEWRKTEEGGKIPTYARLRSGKPFGFAGLWESWQSPEGKALKTCAIVTTEPNDLMRPIHDRMPVVVRKELQATWLDSQLTGKEELSQILQPYPSEEMEAFAVSKLVNSPSMDRPECTQPLKS